MWNPSSQHQNHASKYPEAIPLKNITTEAVVESLMNMFSRMGLPEEILTVWGTQFVSDVMKEVARLLSIRQLATTLYHTVSNGLVEKCNGPLMAMLKKLCMEHTDQ